MKRYDCVVVGGGVVGASLSLAVAKAGYTVLLLEKNPLRTELPFDALSVRTLALSYASRLIYEAWGVWQGLETKVPIRTVQISTQGGLGSATLRAKALGLEALGYVVALPALEACLYQRLQHDSRVSLALGATLQPVAYYQEGWTLRVSQGDTFESIEARLLVAADGAHSSLRAQFGIGQHEKTYPHEALIWNSQWRSREPFYAVERFLPSGALAVLPWQTTEGTGATCIWTVPFTLASHLHTLPEEAFLQKCHEQLGPRYGRFFQMGPRMKLPIKEQLALQQRHARFLLMGNAAHTLHPIAAQGFNLSLRDCWQWYCQLLERKSADLGEAACLERYVRARQADQERVWGLTTLAAMTASKVFPIGLRALGVMALELSGPLKQHFLRYSVGLG